jgi:hypothetical protein
MQCVFVVILSFVFFGFRITAYRTPQPCSEEEHAASQSERSVKQSSDERIASSDPAHQDMLEEFLEQFHKAQCYFSATIQIAALTYGIFDVDMLTTFMLVPLATNGVLLVVFTLVLLYKCNNRSGRDIIMLTTLCWLLSTLVYRTLYSHIILINTPDITTVEEIRAYQQFYYKLSSLDACGGNSALAVCPSNFKLGRGAIGTASCRIQILTPIIWSFSTVCLLAILVAKVAGRKLSELHLLGTRGNAKHQAVQKPNATELSTLQRNGANGDTAGATPNEQHEIRRSCAIHNAVCGLVICSFRCCRSQRRWI